jgi:hypothetical protein
VLFEQSTELKAVICSFFLSCCYYYYYYYYYNYNYYYNYKYNYYYYYYYYYCCCRCRRPLLGFGFFQFLDPIHRRQDSLDEGSARRKAATCTQDNTNRINAHRHPCL